MADKDICLSEIGIRIVERRKQLGYTQEELAEILNVTFATINRWENKRAVPTKIHMLQIEELCKKNRVSIK